MLWSRLGSSYVAAASSRTLDEQRVIELPGVRPAEDLALYRAEMADWPGTGDSDWQEDLRDWVEANNACRLDILERLRPTDRCRRASCRTPARSRGVERLEQQPQRHRCCWRLLVRRGEVAVAGT